MSSQRLTDYVALGTSGDRPVSLDLATGCAGFRWETDTGAWAWDGSDWVNFAGILAGSSTLAGLSDVDFTGPSTNDLLKFDGDFWVDLSLTELLDQLIGTDQGSIITRGASAWEALTPGTEGQVLTAHGADDLTWEDPTGGGATPAGSSGDIQINDGMGGLGALTPASGISTWLATPSSANLRSALTDETGSGAAVFATSPTLVTPVLGTPSSGDATNLTNIPVANATGVLPVANGGTNLSSYTQGDLLYASAGTTISKLAKNTSSTRYLSNTGSSNNPAWAQVDLTNGVTGVLPIANGGTGLSAPPLDLIFTIETVMANAEETHRFIPPACSFPSGAAGSYGTSGAAATGSTTISAKKNGSAFATFVWSGAGTSATVTISSTTSFNGSSDVLTLEGPATADATLAKIGITLHGSRS